MLIGCGDRTQIFIPPTVLATFEHMEAIRKGNNWHRKVPDNILVGTSNGRFCYRTFDLRVKNEKDLFDWVILSESVDDVRRMTMMRMPYVPLFESIDFEGYGEVSREVSSASWDRYFSLPRVSNKSYCSEDGKKTIKFRLNDLAPRDGRTLDVQDQIAAATSYVVRFLMRNFNLSIFDENLKKDLHTLVAGDAPGSLVFPLGTSSVELKVERHDNHMDVTIEIKGSSRTRSNDPWDVSEVHEFVARKWKTPDIF